MKWQTIFQMLTGFKVNIQEHDMEYKKHIGDKTNIQKTKLY